MFTESEAPNPSAVLREESGLEWWEWVEGGVRKIHLTGKGVLSDVDVDRLAGEFVRDDQYVLLLKGENADVYRPGVSSVLDLFGGSEEPLEDRLIVSLRKGVFSSEVTRPAWKILRQAARPSKNRGYAAGIATAEGLGKGEGRFVSRGGATARYYTKDGYFSGTSESNSVLSGIAGHFNATPRNPYCRQTSFTRDNFDEFRKSYPLLEEMSEAFRRLIPGRWSNQARYIEETGLREKGWILGDTIFSTVTVNKDYRTGIHKDAGDYPLGFGNLLVLEGPNHKYIGGRTVFPKYRIAVDLREGDFLGMDVHEWHGNTEMKSAIEGEDDWERVSIVCYVRVEMTKCGSIEEERRKFEDWSQTFKNPVERHADLIERREREKVEEADALEWSKGSDLV